LVKLTGDGALVEFASAVDALSAAIEFQQPVADTNQERPETERIVFRLGLHLGDLIVDGDDLYGDGVNVAARLEGEAPPGGIIVSRAIREAVEGRLKARLHTQEYRATHPSVPRGVKGGRLAGRNANHTIIRPSDSP
jgi:adenylate cyclase